MSRKYETQEEQLVRLAALFGEHRSVSHWRVSQLARGDGQFFRRLNKGGGCSGKTARLVFTWFSANWPEDLEWPGDIPRPEVGEDAA